MNTSNPILRFAEKLSKQPIPHILRHSDENRRQLHLAKALNQCSLEYIWSILEYSYMRIILIWGLYHTFDQMSRVLFAFISPIFVDFPCMTSYNSYIN